jgi:hypothetical protein
MGFWTWFWIWTVLVLFGLGYLGYRTYDLLTKLGPITKQLGLLSNRLEKLSNAIEEPVEYQRPEGNLLDDPTVLIAERAEAQKRKREKHKAKERRLIESLDAIDVKERRFTDAAP